MCSKPGGGTSQYLYGFLRAVVEDEDLALRSLERLRLERSLDLDRLLLSERSRERERFRSLLLDRRLSPLSLGFSFS